MKINPKHIRVAEWFDADDHSTVYVVELKRNGRWVGVMFDGRPQVFQVRSDAEQLMHSMTGLKIPESNLTRRLTCVAQYEGGKGIVPQNAKHIPLN